MHEKLINAVVTHLDARRLLGCGEREHLPAILRRVEKRVICVECAPVELFDDHIDGRFDLVVSYAGVEQLPIQKLHQALGTMFDIGRNALFVISTRFSGRVLDSGEDACRIVRPGYWWLEQIRNQFPDAFELPSPVIGVCLIVTWQPSTEFMEIVENINRQAATRARWERRHTRLKGRLWRLLRPPIPERQIYQELAGKRVALVGNAQSLADRDYGAMIDSADIVIRCNRGVIVNTRSHGSRTDWLCTGLAVSEDDVRERQIQRIIWTSRTSKMMRNVPSWLYASGKLSLFSMKRYRTLRERLGSYPSTGMKAIDLLVGSDCEQLDIFGFDFGNSNSASEPTGQMSPDHDFPRERDYVQQLVARDSRLWLHQ